MKSIEYCNYQTVLHDSRRQIELGDKCYSSPYTTTLQTAAIISKNIGIKIKV